MVGAISMQGRQWSLVDRDDLQYGYLNEFDNAMIGLVSGIHNFQSLPVRKLWEKDDDQVLAFSRGDLVFVFNFNPGKSFNGYGILAQPGTYDVVMSSDDPKFGGYGNIDMSVEHMTQNRPAVQTDRNGMVEAISAIADSTSA